MSHTSRPITLGDLDDVTRVHVAAFPVSDLTRAGDAVVRRYYRTQLERPEKELVFVGIWSEGRLAAFICAGFLGDALTLFVRRNRWFVIRHFLARPWLVLGRGAAARARIAAGAGGRRSEELQSSPAFRVLSVATHPSLRGRGFAGELIDAAEEAARRAGQKEIGLTVEPTNEAAVGLYLKRGWTRTGDEAKWSGAMRKVLD